MKKRIVGIVAAVMIVAASLVWYSCTKEDDKADEKGAIYGTVTDFSTNEPIGGANVKLKPSGETTLTGSDGTFEFKDLNAGKYSLQLSKAGYADLDDDYIIELEDGRKVKRDVQMSKLIASLQITDMEGNKIDSLDFGMEESVTSKSFNIFNNGTVKINCQLTYSCAWIDTVLAASTEVDPGQTMTVLVTIDRAKLVAGENNTFLHIVSNNGSNELKIKATGTDLPTVTTSEVTEITATTAVCGGTITADGGSTVTDCGVCWSTSFAPSLENGEHLSMGNSSENFSGMMTNLTPNNVYYVRAYATNGRGTAYGEQKMFSSIDGLPTVTTSNVTDITATSAKCGGNVTDNGGFSVSARGICWNTLGGPTVTDQHTTNGNGNGTFTGNMTGLTAGTTYFVRAYATNSQGTSYGAEQQFTALDGVVSITLSGATNITATSATCSAEITNDGGSSVTERGICWSTAQYPTSADPHIAIGTGTGSFTASMSSLSPSTTYYVRAYAVNAAGTSYSNQISVTTTDGLPTVTTGTVSNITATTATCGGNVTSDGGFTVTAKGLCWSTAQYPNVSGSHSNEGGGIGPFNGSLTNLQIGTTYYVRAFATNSTGTSYGEQVSFTTGNGLPTVTTTTPTLSDTTVITGGNVTSDGGFAVTARGICYGSLPNPDLTSTYSHTTNGSGTGYYSSSFSLSNGSGTYYIRAYATNANGTSYGEQVTAIQPYDTLPTFTYNGHTYRVAPSSSIDYIWSTANSYCNGLTYYGYNDWRLPTLAELQQMYADRNEIGGFGGHRYWSSNSCSEYSYSGHKVLSFGYTGYVECVSSYDSNPKAYYRPIRMEN